MRKDVLARFWGDHRTIPHHIAALSVVILLLAAVLYTFVHPDGKKHPDSLSVKDMWSIVTPTITLLLGYLTSMPSAGERPRKKAGNP